jgi:glycerol-1-phosphate dehydrogenase [NAD(P)+]
MEKLDTTKACEAWLDESAREEQIHELFPEGDLRSVALQEIRAKAVSKDALRGQLETLRTIWPELKSRLREQLLPFDNVKAMLRAAGAAYEPEQIGISRDRLRASYLQASLIRRRFTILDVVVRAGLLDSFLDQIFGRGGPWPLEKADVEAVPSRS